MDVYTARVIRENDGWWAADITGPRLDLSGGHCATESRSFAALEEEARDIIALMTDRDTEMPYGEAVKDFDIAWDFTALPGGVQEHLTDWMKVRDERREIEARYLLIEKSAAIGIVEMIHATHQDVAAFMDLSPSRVSQVLKGHGKGVRRVTRKRTQDA